MANRYLQVKLIDRVEVRPFAPSDGLAACDLIFKSYGYSYRGAGDDVYDPDAFADAVRSGRTRGHIAVGHSGQAVGIIAHKETRHGELEVFELAVDPEYRGRGLSTALADAVRAFTAREGTRKAVTSAVTRHPRAQRTIHAFRMLPCYLQVGVHPPLLGFRGIEQTAPLLRETFVHCAILFERRHLEVYLPIEAAAMCRLVYRTHELERTEHEPGPRDAVLAALPEHGRVEVDLRPSWLAAAIRVEEPGRDTVEQLAEALADLRQGFVEHVEVRVPLDRPWAAAMLPDLGALGLVATGVDPDVAGRDELCLVAATPGRSRLDLAAFVHPTSKALAARVIQAAPALGRGPSPEGSERAREGAGNGSLPARARPAERDGAEARGPGGEPAKAELTTEGGRLRPPAPSAELLHARLQAVRQLAAGLAHEINNPLNILLGSAYALRMRLAAPASAAAPAAGAPASGDAATGPGAAAAAAASAARSDPAPLLAHLDTIEAEVQRVAALLRQLQRFSDLQGTGRRERVDLASAVEQALQLVRGVARARGIGIEVRLDREVPALRAAAADLQQAFIQLFLNACEASSTTGTVTVAVERRDDHAVLAVRDHGRGIAAQDLPRVLEPFFTTKQAGEGVGLGLSIAASVAESLGGHLRIETTAGKGTLVEMWLPLERSAAEVASPPSGADRRRAVEPNGGEMRA